MGELKLKPSATLLLLTALLLCLVASCKQRPEERPVHQETPQEEPRQERYAGVIVAMGDSLTAGLGVDQKQAYPALLAVRLQAAGLNYRVINGGISGETSRGALERTPWVLSFQPDIVILETGANDGMRGLDPAVTRDNISKIVAAFQEREVEVILCGMQMLHNLGERYTTAFNNIYPEVARQRQVIFMPFFLEGVAGEPELNQTDTIHPTAAGYRKVVDNLMPHVEQAIKASRGPKAEPVGPPGNRQI